MTTHHEHTGQQHGRRVHTCAGHTGEPTWLLSTSGGEWVAECGIPGCGWQTSDQLPELVDDLAAGHALTHTSTGEGMGRL